MANAVDTAIAFALAQVGDPYQWGAEGPDKWDCSSLMQAAYKAGGIHIPRTTGMQIGVGMRVQSSALQPGDLVFTKPGHVQMYIGNGQIVEAPRTGLNVRVDKYSGAWQIRRITKVASEKIPIPATAIENSKDVGTNFNIPNPFGWVGDMINWFTKLGMRLVYVISGLVLLWLAGSMLVKDSSIGAAAIKIATKRSS